MYQAVVLNHTLIDAETIVDELNAHHVVVLNSIMDETVNLNSPCFCRHLMTAIGRNTSVATG